VKWQSVDSLGKSGKHSLGPTSGHTEFSGEVVLVGGEAELLPKMSVQQEGNQYGSRRCQSITGIVRQASVGFSSLLPKDQRHKWKTPPGALSHWIESSLARAASSLLAYCNTPCTGV
jgi:hypothetical protein